jgi:flavin reductase (DIM6/NTAB) family NADH-FMN oxidoreductase RutF
MPDLREVMRKWTTGISIITVKHQGLLHGMTVNSLTSLSIDPPIVAVTMANLTRTNKFVTPQAFLV